MAFAAEMADARRYALDLLRDRKGRLWRFRVPSLLKRQVLRAAPRQSSPRRSGTARHMAARSKWETAVEEWVTSGLTQGVRMAATVERKKRQIERQADRQDDVAG